MWQYPFGSPRLLRLVMAGWVFIGGIGLCVSPVLAAQEWRADHGYGTRGVYTLTEKGGCSHHARPEDNSCGWYGEFVSDDGDVIHTRVYMTLPGVDRQVGDTARVRDGGFLGEPALYLDGDAEGWRRNLIFVAAFGAAFLVALVVLLRPVAVARPTAPAPRTPRTGLDHFGRAFSRCGRAGCAVRGPGPVPSERLRRRSA